MYKSRWTVEKGEVGGLWRGLSWWTVEGLSWWTVEERVYIVDGLWREVKSVDWRGINLWTVDGESLKCRGVKILIGAAVIATVKDVYCTWICLYQRTVIVLTWRRRHM